MLGLGSALTYIQGLFGSTFTNTLSLDLDATDEYVNFPETNLLHINSQGTDRGWSVSFWTKATNKYVMATHPSQNHMRIYVRYTGQIFLEIFGGLNAGISQSLQLTPASYGASTGWIHTVFTYNLGSDNASIIGYIDGVKCSVALGNATYTSAGTWTAPTYYEHATGDNRMRLAYGGGAPNAGMIYNNVAFFDDALTDENVAELYNDGVPSDLEPMNFSDRVLAWSTIC